MEILYNYNTGRLRLSQPFLTYLAHRIDSISLDNIRFNNDIKWRCDIIPHIIQWGQHISTMFPELFEIICLYLALNMDHEISRTKTIISNNNDIHQLNNWIEISNNTMVNTIDINRDMISAYLYTPDKKELPFNKVVLKDYLKELLLDNEYQLSKLIIRDNSLKNIIINTKSLSRKYDYSFIEFLLSKGTIPELFHYQRHLDISGLLFLLQYKNNINIVCTENVKKDAIQLLGLICASDKDQMIMIKKIDEDANGMKLDIINDYENISVL